MAHTTTARIVAKNVRKDDEIEVGGTTFKVADSGITLGFLVIVLYPIDPLADHDDIVITMQPDSCITVHYTS